MDGRNFWVDADIDGRQTKLGGGPRAEDGGMDVNIYQREDGRIKRPIAIRSRAYGDELITTVTVLQKGRNGKETSKVFTYKSKR